MDIENNVETTEVGSPEIKAPENMALGIVGALIGAVLGGASIVLLSQLGYIASLSGWLLALCTLKGYELLGKGISKKGVVICAVLMLVTPFVADYLDWALVLYQSAAEYGVSYLDCLLILPEFFADGTIDMFEYFKNLGMIYLFVLLGGFHTVKTALKN